MLLYLYILVLLNVCIPCSCVYLFVCLFGLCVCVCLFCLCVVVRLFVCLSASTFLMCGDAHTEPTIEKHAHEDIYKYVYIYIYI